MHVMPLFVWQPGHPKRTRGDDHQLSALEGGRQLIGAGVALDL